MAADTDGPSGPPSQEQLRTILEHVPVMIAYVGPEQSLVWANRAWEETTGWSTQEAKEFDHLADMYPDPAERQRVREFIRAAAGQWGDFRLRTRDGRVIDTSWANIRLRNGGNIAIGLDRSDSVAMEHERDEAKRRLEAIFDYALDGILLADDEGHYTDANPAACSLLGYSREELLGSHVTDVLASHARARFQSLWNEFLAAGVFRDELTVQRKDGTSVEVEHRAVAQILPGVHVSFLHDVSERKRVEELLRASERRFRTIFEHAGLGIAVVSAEGTVLEANPACCEILRRPREELLGMGYQQLTHPEDLEREQRVARELLAGTKRAYAIEKRYLGPDGEEIWARLTASRLPGAEDSPAVALALVEDITERRAMQQERERLVEEIRDLTARLAEVEQRERNQLSRELHDIVGSNVAALSVKLSLVSTSLGDEAPDAVEGSLRECQELVEALGCGVRDVMSELRPPMLDEYGLMATLRWLVERFQAEDGPTIGVEGEDPEPRLPDVAETAIVRVAQEALRNAVQHARASRVTVALESTDSAIRLTVMDDGVGLARDTEPWTDSGHWGLITMRERIEGLGGSFRIESSPGEGVRVVAELDRRSLRRR